MIANRITVLTFSLGSDTWSFGNTKIFLFEKYKNNYMALYNSKIATNVSLLRNI